VLPSMPRSLLSQIASASVMLFSASASDPGYLSIILESRNGRSQGRRQVTGEAREFPVRFLESPHYQKGNGGPQKPFSSL
jgi:hypothetical protein